VGVKLRVRGQDGRLLILEEQFIPGGDGGVVRVGDTFGSFDSPDANGALGVILYSAHGVYFAARLVDDKHHLLETGSEVLTRPLKPLRLTRKAVEGAESHRLKLLESICVKNEDSDASEEEIFRPQPRDIARKVIKEGWNSGMACVDVLTPIGRGQSMLFATPESAGSGYRRDQYMLGVATGVLQSKFNVDTHVWVSVPPRNKNPDTFLTPENVRVTLGSRATIVESLGPNDPDDEDADVFGVLNSYVTCTLAETRRDAGKHAFLMLPDLQSHYKVWSRGLKLAAEHFKEARGYVPEALFAPGADRADMRQFYSSLIQRSALLRTGGSLTTLQGVFTSPPGANKAAEQTPLPFGDLLKDTRRTASELNRLKLLNDRGVPLTSKNLAKIGIRVDPPKLKDFQTQHAEELKSISDGHIVMNGEKDLFDFDFQNSLTRIGIGFNKVISGDTRPFALRQVAGPLRLELSHLMDVPPEQRGEVPDLVKRYAAALKHQPRRFRQLPEEVLLLHAVALGYDPKNLPEMDEELAKEIMANKDYIDLDKLTQLFENIHDCSN